MFRTWFLAARPKTLPAAVVPVAVGAAVAETLGGLEWKVSLAAAAGALWIQIGTNFANDVFDFERGADTETRLGPVRAVQAGLVDRVSMRRAMVLAFAVAVAIGAYLVTVGGWPIVVIGCLSIAAGIGYTAGPYPLAYNAWGDLFVFLFFGLVAVCGTAFLNLGFMPWLAVVAAIPIGALSTAILVVNNVRDRHGDAAVGKVTTVVRWGRAGGVRMYRLLLGAAFVVPLGLLLGAGAKPAVLMPIATAPMALQLGRQIVEKEGRDLNQVLAQTAKLLVLFGVLWSLALAFGVNVDQ